MQNYCKKENCIYYQSEKAGPCHCQLGLNFMDTCMSNGFSNYENQENEISPRFIREYLILNDIDDLKLNPLTSEKEFPEDFALSDLLYEFYLHISDKI